VNKRASIEAPSRPSRGSSRPSTFYRGSLKDISRPSTVHREPYRGSHRGSMKKKFVRSLFIEVHSRPSRLPSRVSRVSKKKFPKPNRRARISSTRSSTSPTKITFLPMSDSESNDGSILACSGIPGVGNSVIW
jgi:hypothetical protein